MRTEESRGDGALAALGQSGTLRSEDSVAGFVETRLKSQGGPYLASDRFVEGEVIGRGGTSIVIRAFDKNILRDVAVKVLAPEAEDGGVELERFAEEARIAGQLEHPNILPVYEFGLDQRGKRFLCMRLVEGKTLEQALDLAGNARFSPGRLAEFLQIFVKVCDAVSFAHSRGVIHRDLKPTNIMISEFGQVYVLDWGIARLLPPDIERGPSVRPRPGDAERAELDAPGALIGTACYMAPEQIRGHHDALDERTDVFALGATLYQILTGKPPLTPDIVRAIWTRKPAPPIAPPDLHVPAGGVPPDLSRIALRATAYDPAGRHESVAALKREVEAFQRGAWDFPRTKVPAGSVIVAEGDPGRAAYVDPRRALRRVSGRRGRRDRAANHGRRRRFRRDGGVLRQAADSERAGRDGLRPARRDERGPVERGRAELLDGGVRQGPRRSLPRSRREAPDAREAAPQAGWRTRLDHRLSPERGSATTVALRCGGGYLPSSCLRLSRWGSWRSLRRAPARSRRRRPLAPPNRSPTSRRRRRPSRCRR